MNTMRSDEVYCTSCGEIIKRSAEICPRCGVRNPVAARSSATANRSTQGVEPSKYWWIGVVSGVLFWAVTMALIVSSFNSLQSGSVETILSGLGTTIIIGPVQLVAWITLAISLYFDSKYIDMNGGYPAQKDLYVGASVIVPICTYALAVAGLFLGLGVNGILLAAIAPLVLIVLGLQHLRHRYQVVGMN